MRTPGVSPFRHASVLALLMLAGGAASAIEPDGERLAYVVGCVNCHHQTPKEIMNAPSLLVVKGYALSEFRHLMKTGVTRAGRDMLAQSSVMGIVATEQFVHMSDDEVKAVYTFLSQRWTAERAATEEAKIPRLFKAEAPPPAAKP